MSWGFGPILPKDELERVKNWIDFTWDSKHNIGTENCMECVPDKCTCGGWIHINEYIDFESEDTYYHNMCDKCGLEWEL